MTTVPFIQRIKRTNGQVDLYFRKGEHRCRLFSPDGSEELAQEVNAHLARIANIKRANTPKPGTVDGVLRQYTQCADFNSRAFRVQQDYERYANEMIADIGDVQLREVTAGWVKPEDPRLTKLLSETPNKALTMAYNDRSQQWKERSLNQAVTRLVEALAKKGEARPNLTIHGLRHARGVELALAGASDGEIMSQLEHATDRTATIYRRQADRRKMADAAQSKIDDVIELRSRRRAIRQD